MYIVYEIQLRCPGHLGRVVGSWGFCIEATSCLSSFQAPVLSSYTFAVPSCVSAPLSLCFGSHFTLLLEWPLLDQLSLFTFLYNVAFIIQGRVSELPDFISCS